MYDDESIGNREIANGNWIISFKVTPRFIESSRVEGREKKDVRTVGSRTRSGAIFVLHLSSGNFYFLATSPRSLHSLLSTMNDLSFRPFCLCLCSTLLSCFQ